MLGCMRHTKNTRATYTIGLCGPAASGKTALAEALAAVMSAVVVQVDGYFFTDDAHRELYARDPRAWERHEHIDWEACEQVVRALQAGRKVEGRVMDWRTQTTRAVMLAPAPLIIVEGFVLFAHDTMRALCDRTYYLDVSETQGIERMVRREKKDVSTYAREVVYPAYRIHRERFANMADVVFTEETTIEERVGRVLEDVSLL
jgi:uridine kinase